MKAQAPGLNQDLPVQKDDSERGRRHPPTNGSRRQTGELGLETRLLKLEKDIEEANGKTKDLWDKAQVLSAFFLGVVGLLFTFALGVQQEKNRRSQFVTEITSNRERSEMDFRGTLFQTLLEKLVGPKSTIEDRVTMLRLFQDNFHDTFNGRAFFYALESKAKNSALIKAKNSALIEDLVSIAKETSEVEESIIESNIKTPQHVIVSSDEPCTKAEAWKPDFPSFPIAKGETKRTCIKIGGTDPHNHSESHHSISITVNEFPTDSSVNADVDFAGYTVKGAEHLVF
jgi:hypothetical protein